MNPDEFRAWGHRVVDWIADYREGVRSLPVLPATTPGEVAGALPDSAPEEPEGYEAIFTDFERLVLPAMTHWNHPGFFAYFPANNSEPSILAEMLTAALGAQCMSWQTSPAATELEQVVLRWLGDLLGLPRSFRGVIQDTASSATLLALLMARERTGLVNARVYASEEAHASVEKGARLAGFGSSALVRVPVDADHAMDPTALDAMLERDLQAGLRPAAVVATVGTTSSTALDPLEPVGALCRRHGVLLHVDAAFAGSAALLPEHASILRGVEHADSFVFNPHKWLFTNFDCSAHYVQDVDLLLRTCSTQPEYLRTAHDREVVNFRDWGIPLGRRFRALKLWFVLRRFGVTGLRSRLRRHIALARSFAEQVRAHPDFELAAPVPLSLVCFRWRPAGARARDPDPANEALLQEVNRSGRVFLTHTRLDGRYTLRLAVGQELTAEEDVEAAWELLQKGAEALRAEKEA